jgi:hypothetical protein
MLVTALAKSLPQSASGEDAMDFNASEELFLIAPECTGVFAAAIEK